MLIAVDSIKGYRVLILGYASNVKVSLISCLAVVYETTSSVSARIGWGLTVSFPYPSSASGFFASTGCKKRKNREEKKQIAVIRQ